MRLGKPGPLLAAVDTWTIKVKGSGGHASMPHLAVDTGGLRNRGRAACHGDAPQQRLRSDRFDLRQDRRGTASNIIPEMVEMLGTLRTTSEGARDGAHQGIRRVAANIAAAHLCEAEIAIRRGYPVTVNDAGF